VNDDDEKNDDEKKNENNDDDNNDDENNEDDENDDVENDETQTTCRKEFEKNLEENKNIFEKKTFDVSFDLESSRDQNDVDLKSKKSEKSVDKRKISLSSSFNSFSDFFSSDEKEIASLITSSQRCVVAKSTFDLKLTFDFRRSFRRSSQTSFEKKKRSISSEKNVESSLKRRRHRSEF
jgi:hypothetical protein